MREYCVYKHTTPSGKIYIGITSRNPLHRWNNGRGYLNCKKTIFKSSIIKYGWDNIIHEILYTGLSEAEAKEKEIELIRFYKGLGISLNTTDGGEGCHGIVPWNKGIKVPYKKTNKLKGCKLSEEHKKKLSEAHKGKSVRGKGWKMTEEQKELLRRANTGRIRPIEERIKISENSAMSRPVAQLNSSGEIIATYKSATEAATLLGINKSWLSRCCRDNKLCKGYKFIYYDG